jgi:8-oxo-dGTP diphosphatase
VNVFIYNMVVTAVIGNNNKILILRRSKRVKSFRQKWACISGYFETNEDLLSRALTEIREETKISNKDLILRKILDQFDILLDNRGILKIQPFYFLSSTTNIVLNWEHDSYEWISKDQVNNYKFVPRLRDILGECFHI